jgi:hypothetical protein
MKTNDLKKGQRVRLRNGWYATIADNAKGNTRMCEVEGHYTETGSVYSHDIMLYLDTSVTPADSPMLCWSPVEHTPAQLALHKQVTEMWR